LDQLGGEKLAAHFPNVMNLARRLTTRPGPQASQSDLALKNRLYAKQRDLSQEDNLERILQELKGVPGVPKYYGMTADFVIMQDCGLPLTRIWEDDKFLAMSQVAKAELFLDMYCQLCATINAVHDRQVLHNDLSPANICYDWSSDSCNVYLIDWDEASKVGEISQPRRNWRYQDPVALLALTYDVKSENFALVYVLLSMFAGGDPPFAQQLREREPDDKDILRLYAQDTKSPSYLATAFGHRRFTHSALLPWLPYVDPNLEDRPARLNSAALAPRHIESLLPALRR
jgi:serine/threonine protein kinase